MKIIPKIKIESCYDCPYCRYNDISKGYNCTNEGMPDDKMTFIISSKKLLETKRNWPSIPLWCPLEDDEKKEQPKKIDVKISDKKETCSFEVLNPQGNLCNRKNFKTLCSLNKNCELR